MTSRQCLAVRWQYPAVLDSTCQCFVFKSGSTRKNRGNTLMTAGSTLLFLTVDYPLPYTLTFYIYYTGIEELRVLNRSCITAFNQAMCLRNTYCIFAYTSINNTNLYFIIFDVLRIYCVLFIELNIILYFSIDTAANTGPLGVYIVREYSKGGRGAESIPLLSN